MQCTLRRRNERERESESELWIAYMYTTNVHANDCSSRPTLRSVVHIPMKRSRNEEKKTTTKARAARELCVAVTQFTSQHTPVVLGRVSDGVSITISSVPSSNHFSVGLRCERVARDLGTLKKNATDFDSSIE